MAKRKRRPPPEEVKDEPANMTPMIDVVFQLLIFFMLSMHFKEVEGKLLQQLPKDKGLAPTTVNQPEFEEVRIILCAGGDTNTHRHNKGKHEKDTKANAECVLMVDGNEIGRVHMTESKPGSAAANKGVYKQLGERTKQIYDVTPSKKGGVADPSKRPPVIVDADSEVPYEHVIGAVNACQEQGITNMEFVGNPRLEKYYGSYQKGQFERNK